MSIDSIINIKRLINMVEPLSADEFFAKKRDFSPLLVHLTRDCKDYIEEVGSIRMSAKKVLTQILDETTLRAFSYKYCLFGPNLESQSSSLQDKFKVVCFTETPIDQIDVLTKPLHGRKFKLEPYGLVFNKKYVSEQGGNPVFYTTKEIAKPLWELYWRQCNEATNQSSDEICKLLALVTLCDESCDWHWEREWRIVGGLEFKLTDIYCGLCPEEEISYFENKYGVIFIDPYWGINKILDKLVNLSKEKTLTADDIPF